MKPYGMPHLGAHYTGKDVNQYALDDDPICACCGARATQTHHEPQKGLGGGKSYIELGGVRLRPALIALCTQCHTDRHNGILAIIWLWDDQASEDEWLSGWPLEHDFIPHDPLLFEMGCFAFIKNNRIIRRARC